MGGRSPSSSYVIDVVCPKGDRTDETRRRIHLPHTQPLRTASQHHVDETRSNGNHSKRRR